MKIIAFVLSALALTARAALPPEYFLLDEIPGTDFVGFGYDARYEDARNALQVPMLDYSYTKGKAYIYPADPNRKMRVPDELFVRTVAYTTADSYYYTSIEEMKKSIGVSLGFTYENDNTVNKTQSTCVTRKDPETNETKTDCTTNAYDSNSKMFSVGARASYLTSSLSETEQYIVEQREKTQLYHVYLDTEALRIPILAQIEKLTNEVPMADFDPFFRFLETYGTHYIAGAIMGGQVKATSNVLQKTTTDSSNIGASASFRQVTATEAVRTARDSYQRQFSGGASFDRAVIDTTLQRQVSSSWLLLGGDSNVVDLLDYRNSSSAIKVWKQTITSNPVPVSYRLREVSTLFIDAETRKKMENAVQIFLATNATQGIVSVQLKDTFFRRTPVVNAPTVQRNAEMYRTF